MITARLCSIFDEVVVLERIRNRSDVTPLFKNMLDYTYKSHLILCCVVFDRIPDHARSTNKWAQFLQEILEINVGPTLVQQKVR